jgi:hypothetical protein
MPVTDAILYVHGGGATGLGPVTSTANVVSSGSQAGTIFTATTITSGQIQPGQTLVGTGVPANDVVLAFGSGSGTAGTYLVSQSSTVAPATAFTAYPNTQGDALGTAGSQYSNIELDFGAPSSGGSFPFLTQFPSLTEKTYTFPAEVVGAGGVDWGLHIIVGGEFNNLTSINLQVCTSATPNATYNASGNPIAARTLSLAQLQIPGAHYYIPLMGSAVLEFLRFYAAVTGTNPTAGTVVAWFGPRTGGEQ